MENLIIYWNTIKGLWGVSVSPILAALSLMLGILNSLILITQWVKDKPKLVVNPIHPNVYQWYYTLPDGEYEGKKTKRYGFLCYVGIANKGLRDVSLSEFRLLVANKFHKEHMLYSVNIPQPEIPLGFGHVKILSVLGQKSLVTEGDTHIISGGSISGMAFYIYEYYGDDGWDLKVKDSTITAYFRIQDVFGKTAKRKIKFSEKPLEHLQEVLPGFDLSTYQN
ncbi:MAG: hypothetical protein SFZ03_11715 [Candidatus Melainabacteria bacterium]|nr:hypothetical protein [Candidatus Melainabacteria bacterium]